MADENNDLTVLLSITEMINSSLASIERLEKEAKKYGEMLQGIFDNDPTYLEHTKLAKEAQRVKSTTKQQLMKMPNAADLAGKVKDFRDQIKELRVGMSDYLQEYAKLSGSTDFEDGEGNVRKIVYVARLVKIWGGGFCSRNQENK